MILQDDVAHSAKENYSSTTPWPEQDVWHGNTYKAIKQFVEKCLRQYIKENMRVLNAGSGGTVYENCRKMVHLDIVENYISSFEEYLVGSVESIALPSASVDGIICVGSVLNYVDAQRTVSEFSRILKDGGFLILEFERSESAEFLWTTHHGQYIFPQRYQYNGRIHLLWMYSENHIRQLLKQYHFEILKYKRIHILSSLLYRAGVSEKKAAPYMMFDSLLQIFSRPFAHNMILLSIKEIFPERVN